MDIIQKIKNISIKSVLDRLNVKRSGTNYHCISPTHQDDKASMSIHKNGNYFNCFGCGIGGSVIDLYMILYGISFKEASRRLAKEYKIPFSEFKYNSKKAADHTPKQKLTKTNISKSYEFLCKYDKYLFDERSGISENDSLALQCVRTDRLERNKIIFQELFFYCNQSGLCEDVKEYLFNKRKLSEDVIRTAKIFSFRNYQDVNNYLKSKFDIGELNGSGLFKNDNLIFKDTHRLLIPYLKDGQIIYLRARYFKGGGNTKTDGLKYFGLRNDDLNINSVKRFYNTDILSGLKIYDELFICEGELDCLSLLSIGLNAVAIPGVNSTPINELKNLSDYKITICFDGDSPGKEATKKLIGQFYNIGKAVNFIELPDGIKDVSDFIIKQFSIKIIS